MKNLVQNIKTFFHSIDTSYAPEQSIVLRYCNGIAAYEDEAQEARYKTLLRQTSIAEGERVFHLLTYRDVAIHILDETSLMRSKTIKSIDGCIAAARCLEHDYQRVFFESGGNTGAALTLYGQRAGLETYCFVPEDNLPLLNSQWFDSQKTRLISVQKASQLKDAAMAFGRIHRLRHIPEIRWRSEASMYRGMFILEYMLNHGAFDWFAQTISAAFGPIGIYHALQNALHEPRKLPRFLGVQQQANCPMFKAWKARTLDNNTDQPSEPLLTKVMYDTQPQSYGTVESLQKLLVNYHGDLIAVNRETFNARLNQLIEGKLILDWLNQNRVPITLRDGEIIEKTGLISLVGVLKAIDEKIIAKGARVLCSLSSGVSEADGRAKPDIAIADMSILTQTYGGRNEP
jgi:hypothetical protein